MAGMEHGETNSRPNVVALPTPAPRPKWVVDGEWSWRSFTAGSSASHTVIMAAAKGGGFQHLIELDWTDYDGDPGYGRDAAEALAAYICRATNALRPTKTGTICDCGDECRKPDNCVFGNQSRRPR